jgi:UDP-glucose 4-epimerase
MSKCLVTGGAGFIGSHLVLALLERGESVRILDNFSNSSPSDITREAEVNVGDVRDTSAVEKALSGCDFCFHLASTTDTSSGSAEWRKTNDVVLDGTLNVFDAAISAGNIPVTFASSAAIYGDGTGIPKSEDCRPSPISVYGASKLASEYFGRCLATANNSAIIALRLFNVYGPRAFTPSQSVVNQFVRKMEEGQSIRIHGDGSQTRDFVHVKDVVRAFLTTRSLAEHLEAHYAFSNICSGEATSILELSELVARCFGRAPLIEYSARRPGDPLHSLGTQYEMQSLLGILPEIGLSDGISELVG